MGIRFCCPNGHKLNVKSELAGKIGVCPKCRAKTTIPLQSVFSADEFRRLNEPEDETATKIEANAVVKTAANDGDSDNVGAAPDVVSSNGAFVRTSSDSSDGDSNGSTRVASNRSFGADDAETSSRRRLEVASFDDEIDSDDRLSDANVDWFVQTSDSRSYGPAPSAVLKTWIEEMRVSPTTLVWREGWERWEEAGAIFPQVRRLFAVDESGAPLRATDVDGSARRNDSASAFSSLAEAAQLSGAARRYVDDEKRAIRRRNKARRTFAFVVALVATILGLSGVLVYLLLNR